MGYIPVQSLASPMPDYAGYWLKFYRQGTVNALSMATDSSGATLLAKAQVSSGGTVPIGFIKTVGDALFIPCVSGEDYDAWLFPTSTEADADDTTNAVQIADNISPLGESASMWPIQYVATYVSASSFKISGVDVSADFVAGNPVKLTGGADRYANITSVAFATDTTVTVENIKDSSGVAASLHASMDTAYRASDVVNEAKNIAVDDDEINLVYYRKSTQENAKSIPVTEYGYYYGNVKRYGAVGDDTNDDTTSIQNAIDCYDHDVFVPPGTYKTTSPIQLRHGTILRGVGSYPHPDTQAFSKIHGVHTGAAVLLAQKTLNALVEDLVIDGDTTTIPQTLIAHGRSSSASSGETTYRNLDLSGYCSKAAMYFIASEQNVVDKVRIGISGGGATYGFYTDQADTLSVNSFTSSSNIVGTMKNCLIAPNADISGFVNVYVDAGDKTTEWDFKDNYFVVCSSGYAAKLNSVTSASATRGPITFQNNGAEPYSAATPAGLFYFDAASLRSFYGIKIVNNRLTYAVNAISTSTKVIFNNLWYEAPSTNDLVTMALNVQAYGIKHSYIKTEGTVTIDSATASHAESNHMVINGVPYFYSKLGDTFAAVGVKGSAEVKFQSQSTSSNDPYWTTTATRWYLNTTANSGAGVVLEALPAGDQSFRPEVSATYKLGRGPYLWSEVFASTATINTSDERYKISIKTIDEAEKACALEVKSSIKKFKMKESVEKKGEENARIHFGVIAQEVAKIFRKHALNPFDYAFFCYDEWGAEPDHTEQILDDEGNWTGELKLISKGMPAGNRYGIRYGELAMFILAAI